MTIDKNIEMMGHAPGPCFCVVVVCIQETIDASGVWAILSEGQGCDCVLADNAVLYTVAVCIAVLSAISERISVNMCLSK